LYEKRGRLDERKVQNPTSVKGKDGESEKKPPKEEERMTFLAGEPEGRGAKGRLILTIRFTSACRK